MQSVPFRDHANSVSLSCLQEFMEDQKYRDEEDLPEKLDSFKSKSCKLKDTLVTQT